MNTEHFGHNCNDGKCSGKINRAQFTCPCRSYDVECCPVWYQGAAVRGGYGVSNCFNMENDPPFCIGFNHSGFGFIPYLHFICWGGMLLGDHAKSNGYLGHGPCAKSKVSLWRMFLHTIDIQLIIVCRQSTEDSTFTSVAWRNSGDGRTIQWYACIRVYCLVHIIVQVRCVQTKRVHQVYNSAHGISYLDTTCTSRLMCLHFRCCSIKLVSVPLQTKLIGTAHSLYAVFGHLLL